MIPRKADVSFNYRPKVLVTHKDVPAVAIDLLLQRCDVVVVQSAPPLREDILNLSKGVDAIFWATHSPINAEALDTAGPQLKAISAMSAGIDYVDVAEVRRRNIPIGYTPKAVDSAVADLAVGLMIAGGRRFTEARFKIEKNQWIQTPQWLLGQDIEGSTVGIVGLGNIGKKIAKRLSGFDLGRLLYTGRSKKLDAGKYGAEYVSFGQLISESDYVVIATPLTNLTRNMFNETVFAKMKPTSVLVNIARGEIINTKDLVKALKTKKIFAAAVDVVEPEPLPPTHELMKLPNAMVIPHLGSATVSTRTNIALIAAHNVLRGLAGKEMLAPVPDNFV